MSVRWLTSAVTQIKPGYPIWDAIESWGSEKAGRTISIRRSRFRSRREAIDNIRSSNNPGANLFRLVARGKWDTATTLGQRSVTVQAPGIGMDAVMFVLDKQFVFLEVRHPVSQNATSRTYLLQIGQALESSIRARRESGEDEPDPDNIPPTITISPSPAVLWPPNNKMVKITISIDAQDNTGVPPTVTLVGVTSSAGGTSDISIGSDGTIALRATRAGNEAQRTYTITYKATDRAGNYANASTTVIVPHDQGH